MSYIDNTLEQLDDLQPYRILGTCVDTNIFPDTDPRQVSSITTYKSTNSYASSTTTSGNSSLSHMPLKKDDDFYSSIPQLNASTDSYQINIDVHLFSPNEITLTAGENNTIVVEAKTESCGESGTVSRYFMRRYFIPEGYDVDKTVGQLSCEGVLTTISPKTENRHDYEVSLPIYETGCPFYS